MSFDLLSKCETSGDSAVSMHCADVSVNCVKSMKIGERGDYSRPLFAAAQVLSKIGLPPAGAIMLTVRSPWQAAWIERFAEVLGGEVKSIGPGARVPPAPVRPFPAGTVRASRSRSVWL